MCLIYCTFVVYNLHMNKNIIYGLRDPRNDVYQYIGKSTIGESRPLQHLTKSHSSNVNNWVKELATKAGVGLRFIRELETGSKSNFQTAPIEKVLNLLGNVQIKVVTSTCEF